MWIPSRVKIVNFGLVQRADIELSGCGLYYVTGQFITENNAEISNGSGKTTFLNALWYGLSGKLIASTNVKSIIGRFDERSEVEVYLRNSENDEVMCIRRHRTPSAAKVQLLIGGRDVTRGMTPTAINDRIQAHLKLGWDVFNITNYIAQEDSKSGFIYGSNAERKDIITTLYNLHKINTIYESIRGFISKYDGQRVAIELDRAKIDGKIESAEQALTQARSEYNKASIHNSRIRKAIKEQKTDVSKAKQSLEKWAAKEEMYVKEMEEVYAEREHIQEAKRQAKEDISAIQYKYDKAVDDKGKIETQIVKLRSAVNIAGECPVCTRKITTASKKKLEARILDLEKDFDVVMNDHAKFAEKLQPLIDLVNGYDARVTHTYDKAKNLKIQIQLARTRIKEYKAVIETGSDVVTDPIIDTSRLSQLKKDAKTTLRSLREDWDKITKKLESIGKKIDLFTFWKDAYSKDMKLLIFESVVDEIVGIANGYLAMLYGPGLIIRMPIIHKGNRQEIGVEFKEADGATWRSLVLASGGQRKIVALAVCLAMQVIRPSQLALFMLDEAVENLDPTASRLLMIAIQDAAKEKVVLYVTHDSSTVPDDATRILATRNNAKISFDT